MTRTAGYKIKYFDTVESTNETAKQIANDGGRNWTVIRAGKQSRGRGRMSRTWISPEGGLWFSVILRPELSAGESGAINLISSLSAAESISEISGLFTQIKWPNDVFINGLKTAGILTETKIITGKIENLVTGIGINANFLRGDLPLKLQDKATTIQEESGRQIDLDELLEAIINKMRFYFSELSSGNFELIREKWLEMSLNKPGSIIKINSRGKLIEGHFYDIDTSGGILIRQMDGTILKVNDGTSIC